MLCVTMQCLCHPSPCLAFAELFRTYLCSAFAYLFASMPSLICALSCRSVPCVSIQSYALARHSDAMPSRCNVLPLRLPTRPRYAASMPTVAMPSRFPALLCPLHSRTQLCLCSQLCELHCPRNPLLRAALALLNRAIANIVIALPLRFLADLSLCVSNLCCANPSMPSLSPGCDAFAMQLPAFQTKPWHTKLFRSYLIAESSKARISPLPHAFKSSVFQPLKDNFFMGI